MAGRWEVMVGWKGALTRSKLRKVGGYIGLREFGSRESCINHAKKSKVCRYNLILRGPFLSQDEADSLDQACRPRNRELHASGRRRHFTDKSSVRLEGPLQPILLMETQVSCHHPLGIGHRHH